MPRSLSFGVMGSEPQDSAGVGWRPSQSRFLDSQVVFRSSRHLSRILILMLQNILQNPFRFWNVTVSLRPCSSTSVANAGNARPNYCNSLHSAEAFKESFSLDSLQSRISFCQKPVYGFPQITGSLDLPLVPPGPSRRVHHFFKA